MTNLCELLTKTEISVMRELCKYGSDKGVGRALNISPITVKVHMRHIRSKLGLPNRTLVALWAVRNGLDG